jgi:hypothetical protein
MQAGWNPDPTGRHQHRWYDGARWTQHVADFGDAAEDPLDPSVSLPPPWSASPPPPPAWAASPQHGHAGAVREHPDGTTVLVLGILSLVVCGLLGPVAWTKGNAALQEIDRTPGVLWTNRGAVQAGRICGIVATAMLGLVVLMLVFFVFVGAVSST